MVIGRGRLIGKDKQLVTVRVALVAKMEDEECQKVELYIYDLTQGMAAMMSGMLLGQHFDGIWHTAVVIHGREYFYGSQGIQCCPPVSCQFKTFVLILH